MSGTPPTMDNPFDPSSSDKGGEGADGMSIFLWILVVILFVVFVSCFVKRLAVASGDDWAEDEVYDLGDGEVTKLIESKRRSCLLVYAPWCPHCRAVKPYYKKLSKKFPKTVFAQCDADKYPGVARRLGATAFPTVKVFNGGKEINSKAGAPPDMNSLQTMLRQLGVQ